MTEPAIADIYIYVLFRSDGITPFYIGMGRGQRWLAHERDAWRNRSHKDRIILKMLAGGILTVPKTKILERLARAEAIALERTMIQLVGRFPKGPLANRTDGGEGLFNPDEATRQKMREARKHYVCTPETRAKLSAKSKGQKNPKSLEAREKIRRSVTGFRHSPEAIAKITASSKSRKLSAQHIEAMRKGRGLTRKEYTKQAISRALTGRKQTAEHIAARAAGMIGIKHSEGTRAKMRAGQANRSEQTRKRISEAAKVGWVKRRQNADPSANEQESQP